MMPDEHHFRGPSRAIPEATPAPNRLAIPLSGPGARYPDPTGFATPQIRAHCPCPRRVRGAQFHRFFTNPRRTRQADRPSNSVVDLQVATVPRGRLRRVRFVLDHCLWFEGRSLPHRVGPAPGAEGIRRRFRDCSNDSTIPGRQRYWMSCDRGLHECPMKMKVVRRVGEGFRSRPIILESSGRMRPEPLRVLV